MAQGLSGDSWLGHGLAQWSVKSATAYTDANFSALGVKPYYDHVRSNLLLLQVWWAIWRVGDRAVWTFPEFIIFLLPVGILYVIARLCFPVVLTGTDLNVYYLRVARVIWYLVAAAYACFALLLQPYIFGGIIPLVFASQIVIAALALVASRVNSPPFHVFVIGAMLAQVLWRGLSNAIGN